MLYLIGLLLMGPVVELTPVDGDLARGELVSLQSGEIVIETDGDTRSFPLDSIVRLKHPDARTASTEDLTIRLSDGSVLSAHEMTADADTLTARVRRQDPVRLPVKSLLSLRFRPASPQSDPQWLGVVEDDASADRLVIRRDNGNLDSIEGVFASMNQDRVEFEIDGDVIEAPLEKLEGVVLATRTKESSSIEVRDCYGNRFVAADLVADEEAVGFEFFDQRLRIAWQHLDEIRIRGSVAPLLSLTAVDIVADPMPMMIADPAVMRPFFLRRDEEQTALIFSGPGQVHYRVPEGQSRLVGLVRRDPSVPVVNRFEASIVSRGESLWTQVVGDTPVGFDVEVREGAVIELHVDPGDDGSRGDRAWWQKVRFVK